MQQRRDDEGEDHVPEPVGGCRERDGLGADLAGEDLGRVGPRRRSPSGSEGRDEQIRGGHDTLRYGWHALHDPGYLLVYCAIIWLAIYSLKSTFVK